MATKTTDIKKKKTATAKAGTKTATKKAGTKTGKRIPPKQTNSYTHTERKEGPVSTARQKLNDYRREKLQDVENLKQQAIKKTLSTSGGNAEKIQAKNPKRNRVTDNDVAYRGARDAANSMIAAREVGLGLNMAMAADRKRRSDLSTAGAKKEVFMHNAGKRIQSNVAKNTARKRRADLSTDAAREEKIARKRKK